MSGIYLHIPFCKQACHYCNFHFSTSLHHKKEMVDAIIKELELQKDYLGAAKVETIYFGGGTPSLLDQEDLAAIFKQIERFYPLAADAEITLEANPDDLSLEKLRMLRDTPVNRLSIGIQSFFEADLTFMNRAHNASEAERCVEWARQMDFDNLTIDLIYGSPTTSDEMWQANLDKAFALDIPHLSCYCLTVEPNTALDHFVKAKKAAPVDEEQAARQFEQLIEQTAKAGLVHYEISNFAREGHFSRHNSAYWKGKAYLGIGPSAHSFAGTIRQWNKPHNAQYIRSILQENKVPFEQEILSKTQRYNEYVLTTLRTIWGSEQHKIAGIGSPFYQHFLQKIQPFLADGTVEKKKDNYRLSAKGKLLADHITMELFYDD